MRWIIVTLRFVGTILWMEVVGHETQISHDRGLQPFTNYQSTSPYLHQTPTRPNPTPSPITTKKNLKSASTCLYLKYITHLHYSKYWKRDFVFYFSYIPEVRDHIWCWFFKYMEWWSDCFSEIKIYEKKWLLEISYFDFCFKTNIP